MMELHHTRQNYFQYNNQFYQPSKGIVMGSPISATLAEIYLQYLEQTHVKHYLESRDIIYYERYVDDLVIIFDQGKANENASTTPTNTLSSNYPERRVGPQTTMISP